MKANRKFLSNDDDAVSPVIAVILMVAITVVLAATVYVWVSGFGSEQNSGSRTVALTSAGALGGAGTWDEMWKNYTVMSSTPGLKYSDMQVTIEGDELTFTAGDGTSTNPLTAASKTWAIKSGGVYVADDDRIVKAGDVINLRYIGASLSGKDLQILDAGGNSFLAQVTIQ